MMISLYNALVLGYWESRAPDGVLDPDRGIEPAAGRILYGFTVIASHKCRGQFIYLHRDCFTWPDDRLSTGNIKPRESPALHAFVLGGSLPIGDGHQHEIENLNYDHTHTHAGTQTR